MIVLIPTTYYKHVWAGSGAPADLYIRPLDWSDCAKFVQLDYPDEMVVDALAHIPGTKTLSDERKVVISCRADTLGEIGKIIHQDHSLAERHKFALTELMYHAYKILVRAQ
jgi:hypothetical protein